MKGIGEADKSKLWVHYLVALGRFLNFILWKMGKGILRGMLSGELRSYK